jgi:hypothetical protein
MTTAGLVTGPVTSIGSMAWHSSDAGSSCFSILLAIVAMCRVGVGGGRGRREGWDLVTTGSYARRERTSGAC